MVAMILIDEITVSAPGPGTCPVCATKHDPSDPHDIRSVYYATQFHRKNKRFPTWADAMAHCSELTKAVWMQKLTDQGVSPEELGVDKH